MLDTEEKFPPLHMDKWSRNERLYKKLLEMGLVCSPIFADEAGEKIEAVYVSTELPLVTANVDSPVKRAKVTDRVTPVSRNGDNVIDFPPIL